MAKVCLYFELHQPYRLAELSVFDIGLRRNYFKRQQELNRQIFQKVARKSYLPMLTLLLRLVRDNPEFHFTFSATGVFLDQAKEYAPKVITLLQKLVRTGQVEVLAETYYHSLASLYSPKEFIFQVKKQLHLIKKLFKVEPMVFRNTELIYSNQVGQLVENLGFKACLTEAVERYLQGRRRTQLFAGVTKQALPLLLKHAQLSDDIAFRFSQKSWVSYPLTADSYLNWLGSYQANELINLFMDFETFGEHQWEDTGIFEFFEALVNKSIKEERHQFVTPAMVLAELKDEPELPVYDVPEVISWADVDRDITAWVDNQFQKDSLKQIYQLEAKILTQKDQELVADWRKLQTSDHFYYMCTKWSADGDVHAYFSPYQTPYEAYRRFAIVLADLKERML